MTYPQLLELIKEHAESAYWLHDDSKAIWTLKADLNVTIREKRKDEDRQDFQEEWAKRVPDKSAKMMEFDLYYGASFVETHYIVGVDGLRALMPLPKIGSEVISYDKYLFAKCIDLQHSLDDYIQRCRLIME